MQRKNSFFFKTVFFKVMKIYQQLIEIFKYVCLFSQQTQWDLEISKFYRLFNERYYNTENNLIFFLRKTVVEAFKTVINSLKNGYLKCIFFCC